ncbi:MAG: hypothetical protein CVV44_07245 [Spirochaetae bacterium HGW-Spirochaetae-1]|jgi:alkyl hydroperoxide reductase subunit F|nr:MAG: hypothetical protein CVV44_07245 [Spirochaetae bacterium HGW-Spirochaetae-1]
MDFNLSLGAFTDTKQFVSMDPSVVYDIIILGGGPAGLTAAVYCMRKGLKTGIIIRDLGGQVAETAGVENYMGYRYISGVELVDKFQGQVQEFSIGFETGATVQSLEGGPVKKIHLEDGRLFQAKAVIVTTGKSWRRLGVPGEKEFTGRGVAYCTTCDAPFFAGKKVVVVGGGNSGIEAAIDLARLATHVTIVQFLDTLTGDKILIERLNEFSNVDIIYEHEVTEIKGDASVNTVVVRKRKSGAGKDINADGIFVEIGLIPNSGFLKGTVELNEAGEISIDCACRTSVPGIFAAGDVTSVPFKQIIIAAGEGAKAALSACDYVLKGE